MDRLPDLLTFDIYLVSRDYSYNSQVYHVELSLEGYQDGDKVTGTGFIPDLPTYGDYWFRSPQNFIPIS